MREDRIKDIVGIFTMFEKSIRTERQTYARHQFSITVFLLYTINLDFKNQSSYFNLNIIYSFDDGDVTYDSSTLPHILEHCVPQLGLI